VNNETAARLAILLDVEDTLTPAQLREDFGWIVWFSEVTGCYHARRDEPDGHFCERRDSPRRFALVASSLGRLAMLLLAQTMVDAEPAEDS